MNTIREKTDRRLASASALCACAILLLGATASAGHAQTAGTMAGPGMAAPGTGVVATKQEVFHSGHGHYAIGKAAGDFKPGKCTIQHYANQAPGIAVTLKTPKLSVEISSSATGQSFTMQSAMVMTGKVPNFVQYRASRMKTNGQWFDDAQQPAAGPVVTLKGRTVHVKARFRRTKIGDKDKQVTGTIDVTCGV